MPKTHEEIQEWMAASHARIGGEVLATARAVIAAALHETAGHAANTVLPNPDGNDSSARGALADIEQALRMGFLSGSFGLPGEPREDPTWATVTELTWLREACGIVAERADSYASGPMGDETAWIAWWRDQAAGAAQLAAWCDEEKTRLADLGREEVAS